ncbi:galactosylceramide sulfotransferase-like [Branchiostoma floridae x Branchiostoma japonicum]
MQRRVVVRFALALAVVLTVGLFEVSIVQDTEDEKASLDMARSVPHEERYNKASSSRQPVNPDLHRTRRAARKCRHQKHVVLAKTHKTGSSSIQNILFRYGDKNNLTFVLPKSGHYLSYPSPFNRKSVLQEQSSSAKPMEYDILCHHTRFDHTNIRELMPNDTVYVTVLRDPVTMYESTFTYFRLDRTYNITGPNPFKTFLESPEKFTSKNIKKRGATHHVRNPMFFDLGWNSDDLETDDDVWRAIRHLDKIFHFVVIAEYFHESMVLLRDLLCWDTDDVTTFKVNARSEWSVHHVTGDMVPKILAWNRADAMLYNYFNKTLWKKIHDFRGDIKEEAAFLRLRNKELEDTCLEEDAKNEQRKEYKVWKPPGVDIKGFVLKKEASNNRVCQGMIRPEIRYTYHLRKKEINKP